MSYLAWPLVAALGLVLAFVACVLWMRRPAGLQLKHEALASEFKAFTQAVELKVKELEDGVRKAQAINAEALGSRLPVGLRRTP